MISTGIIGFGLAGRHLHSPLIADSAELRLASIASSQHEALRATYPDTTATTPEALIADPAIELVVIASPHVTHVPLARAALMAGKHVVVDKPFVLDIAEGEALEALAKARGLMLAVYHNRRWDGDFLTARQLVESGVLGDISLATMSWDRHRPDVSTRWREDPAMGGGVLGDLGPHLIDQALLLFGTPDALGADIAFQRAGTRIDDYFELRLHYGKRRVVLSASTLIITPRPRFELHGIKASWRREGIDVQETQLVGGMLPSDPAYGEEPPGTLSLPDGTTRPEPTLRGCWAEFYRGVASAIHSGTPPPVSAGEALTVMRLIALARESAANGRTLSLN